MQTGQRGHTHGGAHESIIHEDTIHEDTIHEDVSELQLSITSRMCSPPVCKATRPQCEEHHCVQMKMELLKSIPKTPEGKEREKKNYSWRS